MYCSECGNQIEKDYSFCTNCGTPASQVSIESLNSDTMIIKNKFSIRLANKKIKNIIILLVVLGSGIVFNTLFQNGTKNPYKVIDTFIDSIYYKDIKGYTKSFPPQERRDPTLVEQAIFNENLSTMNNYISRSYGDKWIENISIKSDYNSNCFYIEDIATQDILFEIILIEVDGKIYVEKWISPVIP